MFRVLYAPFDREINGLSPEVTSALVWEGRTRSKLFTANIAKCPEAKARINERFETVCECLNTWQSLDLIKEMLRSVYYTNAMGIEIRREELHQIKRFYPSFSGHGGSGVDGIW